MVSSVWSAEQSCDSPSERIVGGEKRMKKKQMYYIIVWIALISLFNVLFFVTPDEINGIKTFSGAFWPGYVFITIAFLGHLVFSIVCLSENNYGK